MILGFAGTREKIDVPCTIEIENTHESLHAHVELDGGILIQPGDEVLVHGDPIRVGFGQKATIKRIATVTRANWLERGLTKIAARFEFTELYEVSFSSRSKL